RTLRSRVLCCVAEKTRDRYPYRARCAAAERTDHVCALRPYDGGNRCGDRVRRGGRTDAPHVVLTVRNHTAGPDHLRYCSPDSRAGGTSRYVSPSKTRRVGRSCGGAEGGVTRKEEPESSPFRSSGSIGSY